MMTVQSITPGQNYQTPNLDHETFTTTAHSLLPKLFDKFPTLRAFAALHVLEPGSAFLLWYQGREDGTEK